MTIINSDTIVQWANSPYSILILTLLSISESAFFIIPPEVLLIPLALANPDLAIFYGIITTLSSVFGAVIGYSIGKKGGKYILYKLFNKEKIETVKKLFNQYDTKAIFISAFTPIPFKVFTIAAGVFDLNFYKFIIASILGRGARYLLIASMIAIFGDSIRYFLEHQFDKVLAIGTVGLIIAIAIYQFGLPFIEKRFLKQSLISKIKSWFKI